MLPNNALRDCHFTSPGNFKITNSQSLGKAQSPGFHTTPKGLCSTSLSSLSGAKASPLPPTPPSLTALQRCQNARSLRGTNAQVSSYQGCQELTPQPNLPAKKYICHQLSQSSPSHLRSSVLSPRSADVTSQWVGQTCPSPAHSPSLGPLPHICHLALLVLSSGQTPALEIT